MLASCIQSSMLGLIFGTSLKCLFQLHESYFIFIFCPHYMLLCYVIYIKVEKINVEKHYRHYMVMLYILHIHTLNFCLIAHAIQLN